MDTITVLTFNEPEEAAPIKDRLEQAGIPAELHDERKLQKYWFISTPLAGVRLRVRKSDYERARQMLAEWDARENLLHAAIHCPECGSSRVEYPQFTRKFILPSVGALLCAVGLIEREFYCQECHYTWPTKLKLPPPTDILGWPKKPAPTRHR